MNLDRFRPKNETEDFLLPITKSCERPKKQPQKKPQETLQLKLTQA